MVRMLEKKGKIPEKGGGDKCGTDVRKIHPTTWQEAGASEETVACDQFHFKLLLVERCVPLLSKEERASSLRTACIWLICGRHCGFARMECGTQHWPNLLVLWSVS